MTKLDANRGKTQAEEDAVTVITAINALLEVAIASGSQPDFRAVDGLLGMSRRLGTRYRAESGISAKSDRLGPRSRRLH